MSNTIIATYFETILKTFADAQSPPLLVAYEAVPFTKPTTPWLQCYLLPVATKDVDINGTRKRYRGIFQVTLWVPDGKGTKVEEILTDQIIALYPLLPKGAVSVEATPSAHRAMTDTTGWRGVPIDVPYRLET